MASIDSVVKVKVDMPEDVRLLIEDMNRELSAWRAISEKMLKYANQLGLSDGLYSTAAENVAHEVVRLRRALAKMADQSAYSVVQKLDNGEIIKSDIGEPYSVLWTPPEDIEESPWDFADSVLKGRK